MEDQCKIVVTAALPYSYSIPHLGNFVGSILPADVYYKYLKMQKKDAIFICGSDQHGTSGEATAIKANTTPDVLSEKMHARLKDIFSKYNCTFTYYGKTHTEENRSVVYEIFGALDRNSYIVEIENTMPYCNTNKMYLADTLIEGECPYCGYKSAKGNQCENCGRLLEPQQLIEPHCSICGNKDLVFKKVKSLALALDKLQDKILAFINGRSGEHWSKNAVNKSISYIKEGLKPRDITRNTKWGFSVPKKGYEDQNIYVWFDALIGYIGITKEWNEKRWEEYWKGDNNRIIHFMGKDNIEFHTLVWPGILIGSGINFTMPTTIRASEYLLSRGLKFSKSKGSGIDMEEAIHILPADYWRFILMYLYPETADTDFSDSLAVQIINGVMNDNLGNFINRVMKFTKENSKLLKFDCRLPAEIEAIEQVFEKYTKCFGSFALREALQSIVELSSLGNSLIGNQKPWLRIKDAKNHAELSSELSDLLSIVYSLGVLLWPFTPKKSAELLSYFGIEIEPDFEMLRRKPVFNAEKEVLPLFEKIDEKKGLHLS
jgi:methionyl-tRNA synthetase